MKKSNIYFPLIFAIILIIGILVGRTVSLSNAQTSFFPSITTRPFNKLTEVLNYITHEYVDSVGEKTLTESAINGMIQKLDPHSFYIPAEELQAVNEPLEGNFDGIGVEFHIQEDTIMVVSPISGGPSEALGIQSGDRIVKIEGESVAGKGITNHDVMQKLRGPGGTKVKVSIFRRGKRDLINYTITRGKIPIHSLEIAYMLNDSTGYIKISRFAETTYDEYIQAFEQLRQNNLKSLILDLRGNPGGYLNAAQLIADEFLEEKKLIVYTQGRSRPKASYFATERGGFEYGKLAVLMDEGSASASEIVAGAIQDWDRGTIVGRRSFGKGLVQDQANLPDGSALRLTIARYYTPSGRCIQKSYKDGAEQYNNELLLRLQHGELEHADSISFPDSLIYKTLLKHRKVYGGGGITPDVFVPLDTSMHSVFLAQVLNTGIINQFVFDYVDKNRNQLAKYHDFEAFRREFKITDDIYKSFVAYAEKAGTEKDPDGVRLSSSFIRLQVKALIARQLWKNEGYYPIVHETDKALLKAVEVVGRKAE